MGKRYKMTSVQRRLYAIDRMKGANILYNIPIAFEYKGNIDLLEIGIALKKVMNKHDILRTRFIQEDEMLLQVIEEEAEVDIKFVNIMEDNFQSEIDALVKPFNLEKLPLLRVRMVETNQGRKVLFFDIHHIIFDGASMKPFFQDLSEAYKGNMLEKNSMQYINYGKWIESKNLDKEKQFWMKQIDKFPITMELPIDTIRKEERKNSGKEVQCYIGANWNKNINEVVSGQGLTEYIIFLGAFIGLLARYLSEKEYSILTPVSGRLHPQIENMVGMFVNTLLLSGKIDTSLSVADFLKQLRGTTLESFDHQMYPFEDLIEDIRNKFKSKSSPQFNIMFSFQNAESYEFELGTVKLTEMEVTNNVSKFELTLNIDKKQDGYLLHWEYDTDLFHESRIKLMAHHYQVFLSKMLDHLEAPLHSISEVDEHESYKLTHKFNETSVAFPDKQWIALFQDTVASYPDNIAVQYGATKVTYSDLNRKANYIAHVLRNRGICPGDIVAIAVDRSVEMVSFIVGVIKSGAAYLPIDKNQPEERIMYIVKNSKAKIILSDSEDFKMEGMDPLLLKADDMELLEYNPPILSSADDLIYTIYTSGSTGKPKGVKIQDRSAVNMCFWFIKDGKFNSNTVILQNFNYVFDGSVEEILPTLICGATVRILNDSERKSPEILLQYLPAAQITMVPSMFKAILEYMKLHPKAKKLFKKAEKINLAAENFDPQIIEILQSQFGNVNFVMKNMYGPTEATVCATSYNVDFGRRYNRVPIGKPIDNTRIYIVKDNMLCGTYVIGELWIAGIGLADGYMDEMETQKRFIESELVHERVYKTGDLGYWDEDGNIVYMGRNDNVIKLNGYRIELDEIRNCICNMAEIIEVVVVDKQSSNQMSHKLCVYYKAKKELDSKLIIEYLQKQLPSYMIPQYYMQISDFKRNSSDKISMDALPEIEMSSIETTKPTNDMEREIYKAFCEVLGFEEFGIESSFFELGGDSLKALSLVNCIEVRTGNRLPIVDVLEMKTVKRIAAEVSTRKIAKRKIKITKAREII